MEEWREGETVMEVIEVIEVMEVREVMEVMEVMQVMEVMEVMEVRRRVARGFLPDVPPKLVLQSRCHCNPAG